MATRRTLKIRLTNKKSVETLLQEVYNDACLQVIDVNNTINELKKTFEPEDINELALITKEKSTLLKVKDSAIKIKLDVGRLLSDIMKKGGDIEEVNEMRKAEGLPTLDEYGKIREMLKEMKK
jgi:hypothetical protein